MKALRLVATTPSPELIEAVVAQPQPGPGEVLVHVTAAGIIRTEPLWYPTTHLKSGAPREGAIPSHEFSGTVAALGEGVADFTVGQPIYGTNDWYADGALAEYCVAHTAAIAPAPITLSPVEAATVPISALTAWQGLFDHGHLHPCDRVLIHGGGGSVGLFAVQIAHLHGAHVIATASPYYFDLLRQLGANELIDYHTKRFEDVIRRPVDIVFDTVGGDTLMRSLPFIKPGRFAVTITPDSANSTNERIKKAFFLVQPNQRQLMEVAHFLDTGKLRTFVDAVVPLSQAADAYAGNVPNRKGRGKLVAAITESWTPPPAIKAALSPFQQSFRPGPERRPSTSATKP
ncbi:NADP-dependent oxidoreductase [Edaphobacter bradus]|uniref:NADP-dependent oxidoreductase n=1 Tax=Edaphobacter bradus TaxID=2259016 RepID=UPI0021E0A507|nr:NADP-dependent oxidoreductase [Edaphobacter bradus]